MQHSVYEDGPEFSLGPANASTADYEGFAVDLGMRGCDGLKPPTLALPRTPEPLHRAQIEFQPKLRVEPPPLSPHNDLKRDYPSHDPSHDQGRDPRHDLSRGAGRDPRQGPSKDLSHVRVMKFGPHH